MSETIATPAAPDRVPLEVPVDARLHAPTIGPIPAIVLGGTGYVAGELLRLLAGHPYLRLAGILSASQAGDSVESVFPHLAGCFPGATFRGLADLPALLDAATQGKSPRGLLSGTGLPVDPLPGPPSSGGHVPAASADDSLRSGAPSLASLLPGARPFGSALPGAPASGPLPESSFSGRPHPAGPPPLAVLSAAPHGAAAPLIDGLLSAAERLGIAVRVIDVSADFRFADPDLYARVYDHPHGAPGRLAAFRCALPEHLGGAPQHVAHPGCFTTATLLAAVPLLALGLIEPRLSVVAVTGSTGAGRTPTATTHHPARRSNLFAYSPLAHRHEPEMQALAEAATGISADIAFIPQAGPFARGIHATLQARLLRPASAAEITECLAGFYAGSPFVTVSIEPPRLQDVVGTNRCRLGVAARGDHLAVFSTLDNLVKGAAGGALQWANRLFGFPETAGLTQPGPGWL